MNQLQMFYRESRNIAEANELFSDMVKEGMTKSELASLIAIRPQKWSRFAGFMDSLPD